MNLSSLTPKQKDAARFRESREQFQERWRNARGDLLTEYTAMCPFCDRLLPPRIIDRVSGQWVTESEFDHCPDVSLIRRSSCGCEAEQAAIAAQQAQEEKTQKEHRRAAWAWSLQRAGLEGWLASASFDNYKANGSQSAGWLRICRRYTRELLANELRDQPWLILHGQYGMGKTHLAAAVVREALSNGWSGCYFRPWLSYLRRLMDSFGDDAEERTTDITRELSAGRLVVIDDIDNDRANTSKSGFAETELFRALDDRYRAELPTVLTFNRHPLEMVPWLGAAGVDRAQQYSYAVIEFSGTSYRSGQQW